MKHEGNHKLDVACMKCVKKHIEHKDALLSMVIDFVRVLDQIEIQPSSALHRCAKDLLNKIEAESDLETSASIDC